jgi:hypothetical protein
MTAPRVYSTMSDAPPAATTPMIHIVSTPPGEAPEQVRRAWIGLELPLAGPLAGTRSVHSSGVVSGPRGFLGVLLGLLTGRVKETQGWVVKVRPAMAVLAARAPEAEAWWRQNVPRMFDGDRSFVFAASCAQLVGGAPEAEREKTGRISAASSTGKLVAWTLIALAVDVAVPLAWKSGVISGLSPRLWLVWILALCLTPFLGLLLIARLRAIKQREIDRQL